MDNVFARSAAGRGLLSAKDRRDPKVRTLLALGRVLLWAAALVTLAPVLWMGVSTFRTADELYAVPQAFWPKAFGLSNYEAALKLVPFGLYVVNSLILCLGSVIGQVMTAAMAGYALSKLRVRWSGAWLLPSNNYLL